MTTNNLPAMHTLAPNVFSVSGYNGRGIAPGTVFGKALANHVTGQTSAIPLAETPVTPDSWRTVKSAFYHAGAQAKHLARIEPLVVPTLPVILEAAPRIHVAPREQSSVLDEPRIHRPRAELADLSRTTELDPRVKSEDDTLKAWASRPRANGQARRSNCETKS
eukprot:gene13425-16416_t